MNATEATRLNLLLDYVLERPAPDGHRISEQTALDVAAWLAHRAEMVLGTGLNAVEVNRAWAARSRSQRDREGDVWIPTADGRYWLLSVVVASLQDLDEQHGPLTSGSHITPSITQPPAARELPAAPAPEEP